MTIPPPPPPPPPKGPPPPPGLGATIAADFRSRRLHQAVQRDVRSLYHFYLSEERRTRLQKMGRIQRGFYIALWLVESLLLKLSPARRALLLGALILVWIGAIRFRLVTTGINISINMTVCGFAVLLIILMLELKDKVLARDEIEVARQVQQALLPKAPPHHPGFDIWLYTRPANTVGGDLVDFLVLRGPRMALILGDVAGKGLGAALLAAKLQATLRALAPDCELLGPLGNRLNAIMCRDGLPNRFSTAFLAVLGADGRLRYLNAGHCPPFVVGPTGVRRLPPLSLPLGILPDATYEEGEWDLAPGELVVLHSDGLSEARRGEVLFDEVELPRILPELQGLSAEAAGQRLLQAVDAFVEEEGLDDDLSLVLFRRLPVD